MAQKIFNVNDLPPVNNTVHDVKDLPDLTNVSDLPVVSGLSATPNLPNITNSSNVTTEQPGLLRKVFNAATTPLVDIRSNPTVKAATESFAQQHPVIGRPANFALDVLSSLSSPLNLATAGAGGAEALAGKAGLEELANAIGKGTSALSVPVAAEGGYHLITGKTPEEKTAGALELLGGGLGAKGLLKSDEAPSYTKPTVITDTIVRPKVNLTNVPYTSKSFLEDMASDEGAYPDVRKRARELADAVDNGTMTAADAEKEFHNSIGQKVDETKALENLMNEPKVEPPNKTKMKLRLNNDGTFTDLNSGKIYDTTGNEISPTTAKLTNALSESKPLNVEQKQLYSTEKGKRIGEANDVTATGEAGYLARIQALQGKGAYEKVGIEPLRGKLSQDEINNLYDTIQSNNDLNDFQKINSQTGLKRLIDGQVPRPSEVKLLEKTFGPDFTSSIDNIKSAANKGSSWLQRAYDVPRGLMTVDPPFMTSAAFRQGAPFVGTKNWFKAWGSAAKAFGSENAYNAIKENINNRPLFKPSVTAEGIAGPSYAERVGLDRTHLDTPLTRQEEALRGQLSERIPLVGRYARSSHRAFSAFLDSLRADTFESLVNNAQKLNTLGKAGGITRLGDVTPSPFTDLNFGREIADFVNTATKRGKLGVEAGSHEINLEKYQRALGNAFFSPRSIASDVRMLNPSTYITASPFVRRQYMTAMLRRVGAWWTMASLAQVAGAQVSKDPTSSDFGKIKIGNTRIDPPGGLQQFLVLGARLALNKTTSSSSGRVTQLGKGYKPETRGSLIENFIANRIHPTARLLVDALTATQRQPFHLGDQVLQSMIPMYAQDLYRVYQDNPDLAPIILPLAGGGMGTQNYSQGSYDKPLFINPKYDINIGSR